MLFIFTLFYCYLLIEIAIFIQFLKPFAITGNNFIICHVYVFLEKL
jgi:hypothetical protein